MLYRCPGCGRVYRTALASFGRLLHGHHWRRKFNRRFSIQNCACDKLVEWKPKLEVKYSRQFFKRVHKSKRRQYRLARRYKETGCG